MVPATHLEAVQCVPCFLNRRTLATLVEASSKQARVETIVHYLDRVNEELRHPEVRRVEL